MLSGEDDRQRGIEKKMLEMVPDPSLREEIRCVAQLRFPWDGCSAAPAL